MTRAPPLPATLWQQLCTVWSPQNSLATSCLLSYAHPVLAVTAKTPRGEAVVKIATVKFLGEKLKRWRHCPHSEGDR